VCGEDAGEALAALCRLVRARFHETDGFTYA
jgi:hypothetical protein